jgi:hypothetical protein
MLFGAEWGTGEVFLTMFWFFLFFIWIMLLFQVFVDIFSRSYSGVAKAIWIIVVLVLPYLGVFLYLIVNGGKMARFQQKVVQEQQDAIDQHIRETAGTASPADQLAKLADLHDRGKLTDAEYTAMKAKVVA